MVCWSERLDTNSCRWRRAVSWSWRLPGLLPGETRGQTSGAGEWPMQEGAGGTGCRGPGEYGVQAE